MKSDPKITLLQENIIYNKWAKLSEYKVQYSSSKFERELTRVVFDSGDGAAIFLYNSEREKVLLVRQFRYGAYINSPDDAVMTEVCAGIVEENDPRESAIREAIEETGYHIKKAEYVATVYATPGAHTEKLHLYIGEYSDSMKMTNGGGVDGENEDIEVVEYSYSEMIDLYKQKKINDSKTLLLVQYWLLNLHNKA